MTDEDRNPSRDDTITSLARRLNGYAQGLGLDDAAVRRIVEDVIAAAPDADDVDQLAVARNWMLQAAR